MDRRDVLRLSGALAAAGLAGCSGAGQLPRGTATPPDSPTGEPMTDTPTDEPPTGTTTVDGERLAELAAGNAAFAFDLLEHLAGTEGGNLFFSPYSISAALAMTYAGARNETREQIGETLHYTLGEAVHPAFADLRTELRRRETTRSADGQTDAFRLRAVNSAWGQEGYPFEETYLNLLEEHYGAGLRPADFVDDPVGERERINRWVGERTEGRIEDLLPEGSITDLARLVLANAVYFSARWYREFDPADTRAGTFAALDGTESEVSMMHQHLEAGYASVDGVEAVELPYVGNEVSMVLLLPPEGEFERVERELDADRLFEIFDALGRAKGDLALPRFEFRTGLALERALGALGMPAAFDPVDADFSGMVEGDESDLFVHDVYHDAFVSVDEEGTEATAATAVVVGVTSVPPDWGELRFDRPFVFCIRDRPTDAVLFLGRVVDAGAARGSE